MADQKISELTNITGANLAEADEFVVVDASADQTKAITFGELKEAFDTGTGFVRITGDTMTGDLSFGDNDKAIFGAGNDLQIWHDATAGASKIYDAGAGNLELISNGGGIRFRNPSDEETFNVVNGGATTLYYNRVEKLATSGTGIDVAGTVTATEFNIGEFATSTNVLQSNAVGTGARLRAAVSSAAFPTFSFSDDDNTGIFHPAADTLGFGTAGTEAMRIDSSGNVGIGTSSPQGKLQVVGAGNSDVFYLTDPNQDDRGLMFSNSSNGIIWDIDAKGAAGLFGQITLSTNSAERMRIDASGNVGIGATTVDSQFHIEKSDITAYNGSATDGQLSAGATAFVQQTGGSNSAISQIVFQPRSGYGYNRIVNSGGSAPYMAFGTNNAERMRVTSSGNVGIGTSSPQEKLVVEGATPFILVSNTDESRSGIRFADAQNIGERFQLAFDAGTAAMCFDRIESTGVVTERMRIDGSGRVGIGTSTPDTTLHVDSGTVNNVAKFHSTDATASIYLTDGTTTGGDTGVQGLITSGDSLEVRGLNKVILATGTTDRMTIDSSGNVGIGTSSPSVPLHIEALSNSGTGTPTEVLRLQVTEAPESSNLASGDGTKMSFYVPEGDQTTQEGAAISAVRESGTDTNASTALTFSTAADDAAISEAMRINSSGGVIAGATDPSFGGAVAGDVVTTGGLNLNGMHVVKSKYMTLTTTTQDILLCAGRATYKITMSACDPSSGAYRGSQTAWLSVSNDYAGQGTIITNVGGQLVLGWKAGSGYSTNSRTLQARTTSNIANAWVITVEIQSNYARSTEGTLVGSCQFLI